MREFRTYGSMRGALGNGRPYRDQRCPVPHGESQAEAGRGAVGVATICRSSSVSRRVLTVRIELMKPCSILTRLGREPQLTALNIVRRLVELDPSTFGDKRPRR